MSIHTKNIKLNRRAPSCISLLGVVLGLLTCSSGHAALVQITSIDGITFGAPNGGLADNSQINVTLVPGGGTTALRNNIYDQTGFMNTSYQAEQDFGFFTIPEQIALEFALASNAYASPRRFAFGEPVDASAMWTSSAAENSEFKTTIYPLAPDFGPGSYLGFRSGGGSMGYTYGYLEVTWVGSTQTFTILGGAYESVPGAALEISTSAVAVPEPATTAALAGLATLACAASRRRRSKA